MADNVKATNYAPWLRGDNTNSLALGARGMVHIPHAMFHMGMVLSPEQRSGNAPVNVLAVMPPPTRIPAGINSRYAARETALSSPPILIVT